MSDAVSYPSETKRRHVPIARKSDEHNHRFASLHRIGHMLGDRKTVVLRGGAPWGFRLSGGGQTPVYIAKVRRWSLASRFNARSFVVGTKSKQGSTGRPCSRRHTRVHQWHRIGATIASRNERHHRYGSRSTDHRSAQLGGTVARPSTGFRLEYRYAREQSRAYDPPNHSSTEANGLSSIYVITYDTHAVLVCTIASKCTLSRRECCKPTLH